MRISHIVGHSLVRHTPGRIATYWGRYTEHEARAFAINRTKDWHFREPLNPSGFFCARSAEDRRFFREWVNSSDVVHFHDDSYPQMLDSKFDLKGKKLIYHAHIGSIPERMFHKSRRFRYDERVRHACITNGYGHIFDEDEEKSAELGKPRKWYRLPDILDLNHPVYRPATSHKHTERLRVVYTYSNESEGGRINSKRPKGHMTILRSVRKIQFRTVTRRAFEESMELKRWADVVLEELFSPYLHLSALEGAAVGAMVITNFNRYTRDDLSNAVDAPVADFPFVHATPQTVRKLLENVARNKQLAWQSGKQARDWMLKYYGPKRLLAKYLEFYSRADAA